MRSATAATAVHVVESGPNPAHDRAAFDLAPLPEDPDTRKSLADLVMDRPRSPSLIQGRLPGNYY